MAQRCHQGGRLCCVSALRPRCGHPPKTLFLSLKTAARESGKCLLPCEEGDEHKRPLANHAVEIFPSSLTGQFRAPKTNDTVSLWSWVDPGTNLRLNGKTVRGDCALGTQAASLCRSQQTHTSRCTGEARHVCRTATRSSCLKTHGNLERSARVSLSTCWKRAQRG